MKFIESIQRHLPGAFALFAAAIGLIMLVPRRAESQYASPVHVMNTDQQSIPVRRMDEGYHQPFAKQCFGQDLAAGDPSSFCSFTLSEQWKAFRDRGSLGHGWTSPRGSPQLRSEHIHQRIAAEAFFRGAFRRTRSTP